MKQQEAIKFIKESDDWDYDLMIRQGEIDLTDAFTMMEQYLQSKVNNSALCAFTIENMIDCWNESRDEDDLLGKTFDEWLNEYLQRNKQQ